MRSFDVFRRLSLHYKHPFHSTLEPIATSNLFIASPVPTLKIEWVEKTPKIVTIKKNKNETE